MSDDLVISGDEFHAVTSSRRPLSVTPFHTTTCCATSRSSLVCGDTRPGTVEGMDEPIPAWAVLKYKDLIHVASNHQIFSSRDRMQEKSDAPTLMLVNHDQPEHTFLRTIARKAFFPKRVETDVAPWLHQTIAHMLDEEGSATSTS